MTIGEWLAETTSRFETAGIPSARLDAQVLLGRALRQNKAWLLAHGADEVPSEKLALLRAQAERRQNREPLAYILGKREFYGRTFTVTPDVLVPRPATEQLIEGLKTVPLPDNAKLLDVGTGSGAIAVTAALELPHTHVAACDISTLALEVAIKNAERLGASVYFFTSHLLQQAGQYDCIIANLPYVDETWERSPETRFEPAEALFAADGGLAVIKQLLAAAPAHLHHAGYLLLEADPRQFASIKKAATPHFSWEHSDGFTVILRKK